MLYINYMESFALEGGFVLNETIEIFIKERKLRISINLETESFLRHFNYLTFHVTVELPFNSINC